MLYRTRTDGPFVGRDQNGQLKPSIERLMPFSVGGKLPKTKALNC